LASDPSLLSESALAKERFVMPDPGPIKRSAPPDDAVWLGSMTNTPTVLL
jgi:hypothetical protein